MLVLHEPQHASAAVEALLHGLRGAGWVAAAHLLGPSALESDRGALPELDRALVALRARSDVDPERVAALGLGRGGTLSFLLGCTRRLAATVDVDGPVLHPLLSPARPTQPLELALNLEGVFLGLFTEGGPVGPEERQELRARLTSAARPFELVELSPAARGFLDPTGAGYDGAHLEEFLRPVLSFLREPLAAQSP